MKKLIFSIIALAIVTISCSKSESDPANEQLPFTVQNLAGVWYFKEFVKMDNTTTPYKKISCPDKRDFITLGYDRSAISTVHYNNCATGDPYGCFEYNYDEATSRITSCDPQFVGKVTITRSTLRIDYLTNDVLEFNGNTPVKAIILTRQ